MASRRRTTKRKFELFDKNIGGYSVKNRIMLFALSLGTFIVSFAMFVMSIDNYNTTDTIIPFLFLISGMLSLCAFAGVFVRTRPNQAPIPFADSEEKPAVKKPKTRKKMPQEYAVILKALENAKKDAQERYVHVEDLIEEYFGDSRISVARYTDVLQKANDVLDENYQNAARAIDLFGSSIPTPARLEILNNYVHDSQDILNKIDRIVDELIRVHQSSSLDEGDFLDQRLDELVETTHQYANKEHNDF